MSEIKPKKERRFLKTLGRVGEILVEQVLLKIGSSLIKKIGGKKTLPSILFLLASLSLFAQFPNTGNKQRLGFQTTADGLTWRGSLSDTASIQPINNQNAWVILDTINLKFYTFDFTSNVWSLVGGAAFTQPVDSLFFNVNVPTNNVDTAKMRWDSDLATVVLGLNDNVPNELGFKNFWLVKNQTGSTITKGSLVYANGTVGASGRITVAKFIANGSIDAKYLLGITAHDLTDGEDGYVISFGKIRQVNTDTFAAGAILYPSPTVAGVWTDVEPIAPNIDMPIGFCINSSSNNGTIAIRVASGYKLSELHDVSIASPVDKASLYYSGGLWRDTTAALLVSDTASMLLPYLRDADTATLSNRINLKLNISDTSAFARDNQISGTSGQVAYFNGSNSVTSNADLIYNAANNTLGINTTTTSGANLIIKNSQEPVRDTFVGTQTFTGTDTLNWTRGTGWTFNNSVAVATAASGDLTYTPSLTVTSGNAYEITYTLTGYTGGTFSVILGNGTAIALPTYNVTGYAVLTLPTNITGGFRFTTSSFTGNLDNVRIMQITGSAPVLFAGQDDGSATLYNSLRMPNQFTLAFGGGGARTTSDGTFLGSNAGLNNTTGSGNIFVGGSAGEKNTTGSNNVIFGTNAGRQNSIGSSNVFLGNAAGTNNTTGNNNNFIGTTAGQNNTTGANNFFAGISAGQKNTTGNQNSFIGSSAGQNNTTGLNNAFVGTSAGLNNTTGGSNIFFGQSSGRSNTTGQSNIAIGDFTFNQSVPGSTGAGNVVIGGNSMTNITGSAANNVVIGRQNDLPDPSGSNQLVIKNIIFATGASGTGTTIAAASKAGIKTATPNRDLEVSGEVRITDLTTDAPTRLVGADADGDLGQVTLGSTLSLTGSALGVTSNTFLPLTGGTLTGGLTGTTGTFSGNVAIGFSTAYKPFEVKSNANDFVSVGVVDGLNQFQYSGIQFGYREANNDYRKSAIVFQRNEIGGVADASGRIHILNVNTGNAGRSADLRDAKLTISNNGNIGINDTTPSFNLDITGTLNATGATTLGSTLAVTGNITEAGNNVLTNLDTASLSTRIDARLNKSDTAAMLNPYWRAGKFSGTLPIANGGTGAESASVARTTLGVDYTFYSTTTGATVVFSSNRVSLVITGTGLTTTINLTTATNGRQYMIKNLSNATVISSASNVIPLAGGSAGTAILSAGNVTPQWVTLVADGTNWHVMQSN
jgi:hypothetical protein